MRAGQVVGRGSRALVAALLLAAAVAGSGPGAASGAACVAGAGRLVRPGPVNGLAGVAVSSCQGWAVGDYTTRSGSPRTLIERWDGTAWTQVPSPSPGATFDALDAVAPVSASDAWAVGLYSSSAPAGATAQTLAERWNGASWTQVPTPSPGGPAGYSELTGVAATSASDAWAVGDYTSGSGTAVRGFAEHWNGTRWAQVPTPDPGTRPSQYVTAVAATSASNAWAVGWYSGSAGGALTFIEHWNGTAWTQVPSPSPGGPGHESWLMGVAATSATDAWAVGRAYHHHYPFQYQTLIEHWNGTAWTQVPSPTPASSIDARLTAVTATSPSSAWAVGYYTDHLRPYPDQSLVEHWNGTSWTQVPSPSPSPAGNWLAAVTATSPASVLAVGAYATSSQPLGRRILAFRCC